MPRTTPGSADRAAKRPDRPADRTGPDLSYLHPDRLRVGGTGVFSGDWARTDTPDGRARFRVGFVGVLTGTSAGRAQFECTREVATAIVEAIVADQQQTRRPSGEPPASPQRPAAAPTSPAAHSTATLAFDGDAIVVGPGHVDRGHGGDPRAVLRVEPDQAGRYPVGWGWTWTAVDPADCDRIVGQIPPAGLHQQFVPLIHTPDLRIPHDRVAVSSLQQMPTHNGVAFVADLTLDGRFAGRIENDGNGGPTTYFALNSSPFNWRHLYEYVHACRYRGQPVSEEFVLDALVDEVDLGQQVRAAAAARTTLVRLLDEHGYTLDIQAVRPAPATPSEWPGIVGPLTGRPPRYPAGRLWQIWDGTCWQHLTDVDPATNPCGGNPSAPAMVIGQRYHLRYRSTTQRRDRGAVMVYLGDDGDDLLFDARPAAGTQRMPRGWLRAADAVPADTPPYINKIEP